MSDNNNYFLPIAFFVPFFAYKLFNGYFAYGATQETHENPEGHTLNDSSSDDAPSLLRPVSSSCKNCKCFTKCEGITPELYAKANMAFLKQDRDNVKLAGTMQQTDVQIFILRANRSQWESEIQKDALMKKIDALCRRQWRKDLKLRIKVYWAEADVQDENSTRLSALIVPTMNFIEDIEQDALPEVLESFLRQESLEKKYPEVRASFLHGTHVFICCHGNRDEECGAAGDIVFDTMRQYVENNHVQEALSRQPHTNQRMLYMHKTSCLTGHIYPANMIIVRWDENKNKYYGDSYGYVTPNDVPRLMREHVLQGNVVPQLFKGRIALDPAMAEKFLRLVYDYDEKTGTQFAVQGGGIFSGAM